MVCKIGRIYLYKQNRSNFPVRFKTSIFSSSISLFGNMGEFSTDNEKGKKKECLPDIFSRGVDFNFRVRPRIADRKISESPGRRRVRYRGIEGREGQRGVA